MGGYESLHVPLYFHCDLFRAPYYTWVISKRTFLELAVEIVYRESRKLALKYNAQKGKYILSKVAGAEIKTAPDSQRLINRLFMKGYCDKHGYPRGLTIPWLSPSCMEPFMIIERFNSVINGLTNFYAEFVSNKNSLNRWIYILRYSC